MFSRESALIAALRKIATHPAARGLMDDAAVLSVEAGALVLTHDMLVEGVHFLPDDPADSVAWKLVAVNMSDLAAKGAVPLGVLTGHGMGRDTAWDALFVEGLAEALRAFDVPLLGGDTVAMPMGAPITLGLTAIGQAPASGAPSRSGARVNDDVWVCGPIGDAGAGLAMRQGRLAGGLASLQDAYLRPQPNLPLGQALAPLASAMADVSDGLLIDARRIGGASGCGMALALDRVPLSAAYVMALGDTLDSRLAAATAGDDYRLLFTAGPDQREAIAALSLQRGGDARLIGQCVGHRGLTLSHAGDAVPLPGKLGFEHGTNQP